MLNYIYIYIRGAIGFSLIMAGIGFLVMRNEGRIRRAFGALFIAVGALFTLSALDPTVHLSQDPSNLLLLLLVYICSQALFEVGLFLFGDEEHKGAKRKTYIAGAAWSLGLWLLSLLDYPLALAPVRKAIEDQDPMGPFHAIASFAIYAWPLAVSIAVTRLARWKLGDLPRGSKAAKPILWGLLVLAGVLTIILVAGLGGWAGLYKVGHFLLELWMLAWYYFTVRKPEAFFAMREEIGKAHARNLSLSESEAAIIEERLARIVREKRVIFEPGASVGGLSAAVKIPAYRLSHYFNAHMNTSFSAWLHAHRVEYVCVRMLERPDLTLLEISMEAGYGSKAVFNAQFRKLRGLSPNEYRREKTGQIET